MRKNDVFVAKITNARLTKIFEAIFALAERLPTSATLLSCTPFPVDKNFQHDVHIAFETSTCVTCISKRRFPTET